MALFGRIQRWFAKHVQFGYTASVEVGLARAGGEWDGIRLGRRYRAYVMSVPRFGEVTPKGRPKKPVCRLRGTDGRFIGRHIVTDVNRPVQIGQELNVLITAAQSRVVFGTAES